LVKEEEVELENNGEILSICKDDIEWKPELDALLRYGSWVTSTRKLYIHNAEGSGMPENFVKKLLLHLANSRFAFKGTGQLGAAQLGEKISVIFRKGF
jgi:hypothetical protein